MRPVLFEIPVFGGIPIYSYGVMLGLSLIVGWYLAMWLAQKDGLPREKIGSCYIWTAVFAVLGSRVLYVITNLDSYTAPRGEFLDIFKVSKGGLVAYGGFLGGFISSWVFCAKHKISILAWADDAVPSIALGTAITRVGCLLFGCDFGATTTLPWGIRFGQNMISGTLQNTPALAKHLAEHKVAVGSTLSLPVHPTQVYETLVGLTLVGILMLTRRYWRRFSGQIFCLWVMGYGVLRYLLELVRDDPERGGIQFGDGLTWPSYQSESQLIGLVTLVLAAVLYVVLQRRARRDPERARLWEHPWVAPEGEEAPAPRPASAAIFDQNRAAKARAKGQKRKKR
ncbi:MAG TPA: prolipoprotein diacylglyceryl transferase [Polyangia bacterium]|jgi:phosphatidylglycerol:prolipoprotein diacylglycerol transferase